MSPILTIAREAVQHAPDRTLGTAALATEAGVVWQGYSLEPPWIDADGDGLRDRGVSCIPPGTYRAVPHGWGRDARWTRFDQVWRLEGVPGGSAILVHALNYPWQTRGCIGLGEGLGDLDGDGRPDLVSSRAAIRAVRAAVRRRWLWIVVTQAAPPLSDHLRAALARQKATPLPPGTLTR
ncbi:MAG: DUF5675 family protein [Bacteroidota bacterium]